MRISQRRETAGQPVKPVCPGDTARSDEVIASSGVPFHLWRLYQHAWFAVASCPGTRRPGMLRDKLHLTDVAASGALGGTSAHTIPDGASSVDGPGHAGVRVQPGGWFCLALAVHRDCDHCGSPAPDARCLRSSRDSHVPSSIHRGGHQWRDRRHQRSGLAMAYRPPTAGAGAWPGHDRHGPAG